MANGRNKSESGPLAAALGAGLAGVMAPGGDGSGGTNILSELDSAFPAPKPVVIRTATLRLTGRSGKSPGYSVQITIPKAVVEAVGWGLDQTLLVSGWGGGVVKLEPADTEGSGRGMGGE